MRILFLDQFADLGGGQRCLLDLLPAGRRAGWEMYAAVPGEGAFTRELAARSVTVLPLSLGNYSAGRKGFRDAVRFLADLRRAAGQIRALVGKLDIALLYVNGPRVMPAVARAKPRKPVIFHALSHVNAGSGRAALSAALRAAQPAVIAASRFVAKGLGRPAAAVVYNGVDGPPDGWRRRLSPVPRIGMVGRLAPQKGQKEFVAAAARLARRRPEIEFYLCGDALFGDPKLQRYKQEVLALAPPGLRFLGWREDVYEVLANLDVLVMPAVNEGLPRAVLEAFAAGVPVLALASGAIPEIVEDGGTGFLLRSRDPAEIERRLEELLAEPARLARVAERARQAWRERFTAERYREQVWRIIEAAARGGP